MTKETVLKLKRGDTLVDEDGTKLTYIDRCAAESCNFYPYDNGPDNTCGVLFVMEKDTGQYEIEIHYSLVDVYVPSSLDDIISIWGD